MILFDAIFLSFHESFAEQTKLLPSSVRMESDGINRASLYSILTGNDQGPDRSRSPDST